MTTNHEWSGWELSGVIVCREHLSDSKRIQVDIIKHPLAMPNCKQHCCMVWKGNKVFVSIMDNMIECVGDKEAKAIMDLFSLQYGLGAVSSAVGLVVHGHEDSQDSPTTAGGEQQEQPDDE